MQYTYRIEENGYIIMRDGRDYLCQLEPYILNKNLSYEENAKLQIQEQIERDNDSSMHLETLEKKINNI